MLYVHKASEPEKRIPIDPTPACYWVFQDDKGLLHCMLSREFVQQIEYIQLKNDGGHVAGDKLVGVFVSHFATCKDPAGFSRANQPTK